VEEGARKKERERESVREPSSHPYLLSLSLYLSLLPPRQVSILSFCPATYTRFTVQRNQAPPPPPIPHQSVSQSILSMYGKGIFPVQPRSLFTTCFYAIHHPISFQPTLMATHHHSPTLRLAPKATHRDSQVLRKIRIAALAPPYTLVTAVKGQQSG
jgi:hypothetical protein